MALNAEMLKTMVRDILAYRDDELDCSGCFAQLDRYVELELAGVDAAAALPLVADHLQRCGHCRQEYEALLAAIQSLT